VTSKKTKRKKGQKSIESLEFSSTFGHK
jgi:hypothetical protein